MSLSIDIDKLVKAGEGENLEFKTSFNTEVIETLVAFANASGGNILIGINKKHELSGVSINSESVQNWINEIKTKTSPALIPDATVVEINDKKVVVFSIPEYPIKPVATRGKYFKRVTNSNHLMSLDEIANEYLKTINSSWDFYPDPNHGIEHISLEKVNRFISRITQYAQTKIALSPMDFLVKLEIIRKKQLSFGGYLLFLKDYGSISDVQVGRFKSPSTIIDSISVNTDLFSEVDEILFFIRKHLMVEYIITGESQRTERFDYPIDAIREIVINMIVHRDYRDSSHSIIKIFDDKIEFFNPGKLYGNLTIANLLSDNYTSQTRNKLIAKAFKEIGLIERYGSGIRRIINICSDYGLKQPLFEEIFNGFRVILFKAKLKVTDKVTDNLSENQSIIVGFIAKNNQITTRELSEKVNISQRKIKENLSKLKEKGIVERIGPARGGYWKVTPRHEAGSKRDS
ncbi:putative DNA binding domain-containing protein [bacterium]|nr:putative DNA binding domain-containing protein [bacterium]